LGGKGRAAASLPAGLVHHLPRLSPPPSLAVAVVRQGGLRSALPASGFPRPSAPMGLPPCLRGRPDDRCVATGPPLRHLVLSFCPVPADLTAFGLPVLGRCGRLRDRENPRTLHSAAIRWCSGPSAGDLFAYESGDKLENLNDVTEVVNYVKAMNYGLERLQTLPMSLRLIKEIHGILLEGVRGSERHPGEFKRSQNWIGPPGCTLNEASYVPPPPHEALEAMGALERYIHAKERLPILIDCALIHYQFETIHPFLDGKGRMGRLLITFYLCWKGVLHKPLLYLSYYFKKSCQEYYDRLNMVRESGHYEQWVDYFLKGVEDIAGAAMDTARRILELQTSHRRLLWEKKISSPIAVGILEQLFYTPTISITQIAARFDVSSIRRPPRWLRSWKRFASSGKPRAASVTSDTCTTIT